MHVPTYYSAAHYGFVFNCTNEVTYLLTHQYFTLVHLYFQTDDYVTTVS